MFDKCAALEMQIQEIKHEDLHNWKEEITNKIKAHTSRKEDVLNCKTVFDVAHFMRYLYIFEFYKDFITEKHAVTSYIRNFNKIFLKRSSCILKQKRLK